MATEDERNLESVDPYPHALKCTCREYQCPCHNRLKMALAALRGIGQWSQSSVESRSARQILRDMNEEV